MHVVGIGVHEVKSQTPAFSLEKLALAITPLVAFVVGDDTRVGLHGKHDKWNGALARRASQLLERAHNAFGANHVPILLWQCRIFIEVRRSEERRVGKE